MNITVINGTEKHGVTYRLKETFLTEFRDEANITEYYLPKDCPNFCVGCLNCTLKGEKTCKDAEYIRKMDESLLKADLIVMTSPAYVFHVTGAMKALLDHFAYRWMPHRPAPEMFGKRAVIITQCLGSGAKSAAKDIKHSLSWWGISEIGIFSRTVPRPDVLPPCRGGYPGSDRQWPVRLPPYRRYLPYRKHGIVPALHAHAHRKPDRYIAVLCLSCDPSK